MIKVRILVRLKEEVSDAAGRTVCGRLNDLGFSEITNVRVGKLIEMELASADPDAVKERIAEMARQLLVAGSTEELEILEIT